MLDSNVVLDKFLRREPHFDASNKVCLLGLFGDAENYVSVAMLTDLYYFLAKSVGSASAHDMLAGSLEFLRVCGLSADDAAFCLSQRWNDFEDCLVARCAENIGADYIITRNKDDFVRSLVPALNPDELLTLLQTREGLTYHEIVCEDGWQV
jgi:predicted nucleic acid-binding protein